jgi:hypothetical protein
MFEFLNPIRRINNFVYSTADRIERGFIKTFNYANKNLRNVARLVGSESLVDDLGDTGIGPVKLKNTPGLIRAGGALVKGGSKFVKDIIG